MKRYYCTLQMQGTFRMDNKIKRRIMKAKAERLIYIHASAEAYKAGIITLAVRSADPRALLLPGREAKWLHYVGIKGGKSRIRKALPDLEEATRLHPPINALVKELHKGVNTERVNPKLYRRRVRRILKKWKEQGRPPAGPQLINNTLLLIEGKKGQLFLHCNESQEKIRFVISAEP